MDLSPPTRQLHTPGLPSWLQTNFLTYEDDFHYGRALDPDLNGRPMVHLVATTSGTAFVAVIRDEPLQHEANKLLGFEGSHEEID